MHNQYRAAAEGHSTHPHAYGIRGVPQHLEQHVEVQLKLPAAAAAAGCCATAVGTGRAAAGQQKEAGDIFEALREHVVV